MANDLINGLFSNSGRLEILDTKTGARIAATLKVKKVNIKWTSTVMRHQREDGLSIIDTRVVRPAFVLIQGFIPDPSCLAQLASMLKNRDTFYQVTTRGIVLPNMMLNSDGMTQSSDMMSGAPVRLEFKQVFIEGVSAIVFAQAPDSSLVDRGVALMSEMESGAAELYQNVAQTVSDSVDSIGARAGALLELN